MLRDPLLEQTTNDTNSLHVKLPLIRNCFCPEKRYSNPFCFKIFSGIAILCFREAAHFKIARHAFLLTAKRTASVGGEPSRPCDSPAPPKECSSSTLDQEFFQKAQNSTKVRRSWYFHTLLITFANLLENFLLESLSSFVMPPDNLHRGLVIQPVFHEFRR